MYFSLEIELNNGAIQSQQDVIVVLKKLIEELSKETTIVPGTNIGSAKDSDNNPVGIWLLKK